ncbi:MULTISPECIES: helix-turn-helix domain-containing protein [Halomonas]|uniref:helix-turn-helix domain-containing protein n=1 Tax=Halomonas TaxID=2745 RepID=UPI001C966932|nr:MULTISPECIES: cupin domain-containing protein [Halomonas]MBY6208998.1 cupin domain-containing protein [Halomonas sp. DP3Y7-2]MBY6227468.1 cupin domain-containing protein [Halomonas sp. DP3Y7-1]MCA0914781.1 cupin domain-containing protein [Halomonas denitrificans]
MDGNSSRAPEQDALRLGQQIRDLRRARKMTLATLAERINRSVGYLSQVERGTSSLPIGVLQSISDVLGVRVSWFFDADADIAEQERDVIVRASARRAMEFSGIGVREELLSPRLSGQLILIMTRLEPGGSGGEVPRQRKGEEAGYVEAGQLELTIGDQQHRLEAGDSFSITGDEPHLIRNPGDSETRVIWVMTGVEY